MPLREEIYNRFDKQQAEWEKNGLDLKEIQQLYQEVTPLIEKAYLPLIND